MNPSNPFIIYNASAGSGKTFTLVKDYLKILLQSNNSLAFRNILALTFTNKAVGEMKERIIETLQQFANPEIIEFPNNMFNMLSEELTMTPETLHNKSKTILNTMVHNYAAFDISTIDKFNHRLIRTFAHDLKLPPNFEVELDTTSILAKAVDKLIDKAGTDKTLTKVLVDFAIEKADDDKSWDIAYDFNAIAKLLVNENEIPFIDTIKDKTLDDFKSLTINLKGKMSQHELSIIEASERILTLIDESGLQFDDFSGSYLPKHFQKLVAKNFNIGFESKWQEDLENKTLYPKRVTSDIASIIDSIQPDISNAFAETKDQVFQYKFLKNCLKNLTPLSILNAINLALKGIKEEEDLVLISEFNSIISNEVNQQPAPYIYERIGEKFKHYFIDEFQDTSQLQWKNLSPLIENALSAENLSGETGSAMIVGDAKQAIYRWRGGKAEQFIDLHNKIEHPFVFEQEVKNLPVNYRSKNTIVAFNNAFFSGLSGYAFTNEEHQNIYQASTQDSFLKEEGYVELLFLEVKREDKNSHHCEQVLKTVNKAVANGFDLSDICIITRKTKEGISVAEFLSDHDIPIVSSETLLLQNSPEVNFISSIINLANQPKNSAYKIEILYYLAEYKLKLENRHFFYSELVHLEPSSLFKALEKYGYNFDFNSFLHQPLYEAVETIIRTFELNENSNAYIQFYLEEVLSYSQKYNASWAGFTSYWELKKEKLCIVSPQGIEAIQIMTIHKSKGLEFPVVIFPFANQDIYFDMSPKVWFPVEKQNFNGFSHLYINLNKDLENYSTEGAELYADYQAELELDAINLLYVVLTRAVEQLFVISELDLDKNQNEKLKVYSGLFINYLKSSNLWSNDQHEYQFGNAKRISSKRSKQVAKSQTQFISTAKEDHNLKIITNSGYLWDSAQVLAIEKGNLVHYIMSFIKSKNDIDSVFDRLKSLGKLNESQSNHLKPLIQNLINHKLLAPYFNQDLIIHNERDIITAQGQILRPDRVVINSKGEAVIIDYKTGLENPKHKEQLYQYQDVLEEMNFKIVKKILVYINDAIKIKEF
ncbi:DNA helicase UvrD [Flavobacteriales bacterium 34_180_T64]|nr:DNA helicase UvrD [Flavobacteriales bacterium 34_180_T64]